MVNMTNMVNMANMVNMVNMVNMANRYVDMGAMRFPPSHILLHGVLAHLKVNKVKS